MQNLRELFDLTLTFDHEDAIKYGMLYHPIPYSKVQVPSKEGPQYDLFFIGADKGRLNQLLDIHAACSDVGVSCDFHITDVEPSRQHRTEDIDYSKHVSYREVLDRVQRSGCILELLQPGQTGYSLRTMEAVAYGRRLLTNNRGIASEPFYNSKYISTFGVASDLDLAWLQNRPADITYGSTELLPSPRELLSFIERSICGS